MSRRSNTTPSTATTDPIRSLRGYHGTDETFGEFRNSPILSGAHSGSLTHILSTIDVFGEQIDSASEPDEEEQVDDSDNSVASSSEDDGIMNKHFGGMRYWCPRVYFWLAPRVGTSQRFLILSSFLLVNGAGTRLAEYELEVSTKGNIMSILWLGQALSFVVAVIVSFALEGHWAIPHIFSCSALLRWSICALFSSMAVAFRSVATMSGLDDVFLTSVESLYVGCAVVISFFVFRRVYGKLEWLSLVMVLLSALAFYIMRERCEKNACNFLAFTSKSFNAGGFLSGTAYMLCGVIASILMERILKNRSRRLARIQRDETQEHNHYYIHRVHLDFASLVLLTAYCLVTYLMDSGVWVRVGHISKHVSHPLWYFDVWKVREYILIILFVVDTWLAGLVCQHFSTVTLYLTTTVAGVASVCIIDPITKPATGIHWGTRAVPSVMIAVIVVLSAIVFQTGRLNMSYLKRALGIRPLPEVGGRTLLVDTFTDWWRSCTHRSSDDDEEEHVLGRSCLQGCAGLMKYALPVLYIFSNAMQTELQNVVASNYYFVPQSLSGIGIPLSGMCLAIILTASQFGFAKVKEAFDPCVILRFLGLGFLQAVVSALSSLSYALHISSTLFVAVGKIYTPMSLILGRLIMKKHFLWIEWLSVAILFDASITLAALDFAVPGVGSSQEANLPSILCAAASASTSCLYSVMVEISLKGDDTPYVVNKIRLDFGALLWGIAFLPLMGFLGVFGGRSDLAYWVYRPNPYWTCSKMGHCSDTGDFVLGNVTMSAPECVCGNGVFLGWGNWVVYSALGVGVIYSWLTGRVIQEFSTVMRAVLDGFPIVLLWFFVTPSISRIPLQAFKEAYYRGPIAYLSPDWSTNLITLLNPVSALSYIQTASQVREVAEMKDRGRSAISSSLDLPAASHEIETSESERGSESESEP